jgi:uncharacterized membrane protein YccC
MKTMSWNTCRDARLSRQSRSSNPTREMWRPSRGTVWPILVHSVRTAVACVASLLVARLFRLPEAYWAPITTLVITQSSLGGALAVSWQRFVGTFLGAALGATVAGYFGPNVLAFGMCLFILGMLRILTHSDLKG